MITPMQNPTTTHTQRSSKSQLDLVRRALAFCSGSATHQPEPTISLDIGKAMHCLILEPDEFDKRFATLPELDLRTNAGKAERDISSSKMLARRSSARTYDHAAHDARIGLCSSRARALLEMDGTPGTSMFWRDPGRDSTAAPALTGGYVRAALWSI